MCFLSFHVDHIKAQAQGKSLHLFLWNGRDFPARIRLIIKPRKPLNRSERWQPLHVNPNLLAHPNQGWCLNQTINEQTTQVWTNVTVRLFVFRARLCRYIIKNKIHYFSRHLSTSDSSCCVIIDKVDTQTIWGIFNYLCLFESSDKDSFSIQV